MRWRAAQLNAQGLPFDVQRSNNNTYIFFVQQPPALDPWAYQPPPRPKPGIELGPVLRWLLVVTTVTMLLGTVYMLFSRQAEQPQQQATQQQQSIWDWFDGLRLPWEPEAPAQVQQPQATADGFKWPWESAADGIAQTAESVQATVTVVSGAVLAVLVLLIILALVRRKG